MLAIVNVGKRWKNIPYTHNQYQHISNFSRRMTSLLPTFTTDLSVIKIIRIVNSCYNNNYNKC